MRSVLEADSASQIFTADEPEVDALPRQEVVSFLEKTDIPSCISYLQHIIDQLHEEGADFHDKLGELLIARARQEDKGESELPITLRKFVANLIHSGRDVSVPRWIPLLLSTLSFQSIIIQNTRS